MSLLAEPSRACLYYTMSTSNEMWWLYFEALLCDCTITQALSVTYARKSSRTRAIKSVVYGRNAENEPVLHIKNGQLPCAREYGSAIFGTKPLYENRQINSGASTILSP